jgi:hypothetical protein
MKGAKTSLFQLCGFSLLSQISVMIIIYARPVEIDPKHQCGDGRSHFSTDSRKNQSLVPSRSTSLFASTTDSSCCPSYCRPSRRRRAPRIKKKRARKQRADGELEPPSSLLSSPEEEFDGCFPWFASETAFLYTSRV